MLGRYSVKKPYTVIVGVILVLVLGFISFSNMTTDLLPSMNFPYVIVYTTYVGATPEQIESEVTRPMEASFATLTDIKNITSRSSDNLSLVVLEFNDTADLNTAMIEINSEITTLSASWNDTVGSPAIMKINPDMLPVSIVSVSRDDMDIYELSDYVEDVLIPEYESINGVASVSASGMISQEVDVTIEQDRIDVLNNAILRDVDAELADVEQQLNDAQAQISDGKSQLARQKKAVLAQLNSALSALNDGEGKLSEAIAQLKTQRDQLNTQLAEVNAGIAQLEKLVNMSDAERALLLQMEQQLGNLRGQKDYWEKQLEALENGEGNESLLQERADAVARRDALIAERDRLNRYIEDLQNADADALNADIAELNAQIAAAQESLAAAQADLAAKTADRNAASAYIEELKQAIAEKESEPEETNAPGSTSTPDPNVTDAPGSTSTPDPGVTDAPASTGTPDPDATNAPASTGTPDPDATDAPGSTSTPDPDTTNAPGSTSTPDPDATDAPGSTDTPAPDVTDAPVSTGTPDPGAADVLVSTDTPDSDAADVLVSTDTSDPDAENTESAIDAADVPEAESTDTFAPNASGDESTANAAVTLDPESANADIESVEAAETETPAPDANDTELAVDPTETPDPDAETLDLMVEATDDACVSAEDSDLSTANPNPLLSLLSRPFSAVAEDKTLEELKTELAQAEAALAEKTAQADAAQAQVDEANATVKALQEQLSAKQQALEDIQSGSLQTRIEAAQREVARLNLRIGALDAEIQGIDDLLSGGDTAIGMARQMLAQLDAAIAQIENSDEYKALQLIKDKDALNAQYAAALAGKAQLEGGIAQIDATLEKLESGMIPGGMIDGIDEDTSLADARSQLESGRRQALSAFADAETQLAEASAKLAEGRKEFEDKRDEALKNAGLDGVITVEMVAGLLGAQNLSMPAGYVYDVSNDQYLVRVGDKFASLTELRTLKLFSLGMESVDEIRLTDVARVEIVDNADEVFTKVDGQDGILLSIEKQSTFSTTDVSDRVAAKNAELVGKISGLHVVDMFNQGDYINIIVDSVLENLIWGGLLAVLVLLIFLMDWRPTLIVAISIPLSVVAAFVCMYFSGITLNVLSLSGLALGIGMLVDNSIVAIENIYRLRNEEHMPILHACVEGVHQVSASLFASTLTTICVFLPVVFVTGLAHDMFVDLGLTIAFSLLASLVAALTVVPSMAASLLRRSKASRTNGLFLRFQKGYVLLLKGALRVKPLVLLAAVALLAFTVMQVPGMGMSFMPQVNSTQMTATLEINPDEDLAIQQDRAVQLMEKMMDVDGIATVGLSAGGGMAGLMGGGDSLTYYIIVNENSGRQNADIARDIRSASDALGMDLAIKTSTMDISMLTGSGISVDITGDDADTMQSIARDVADIIRTLDGAVEINDGLESAAPEMRITVDKELASDNNLTIGQIYQFIAKKLYGKMEITQATLDGKTLSVYVIDGRNASITPDTLADLEMEVTSGDKSEMVRIGDVAEITQAEGFSTINRTNQQRILSVSFQIAEGYSANHVSDALEEKLSAYPVPEGYHVALSGENETVTGIMGDLTFMVVIAVVMIFLIMVAQFQSFKSPIIVMFTIPLAFTGGLLALKLTNMDLSIVAMVGFLVLSGVIVNNGIVFVDCVNQLRVGGMPKKDALVEAGRLRLRPILMTAVTTILGMLTMALGVGMGAEMMQPMAVVTIGGLSYATLMTLFIVPCMYDLVNGEKMSAREIQMAKEAAGMNGETEESNDAAEHGAKCSGESDEKPGRKKRRPAKAAAKETEAGCDVQPAREFSESAAPAPNPGQPGCMLWPYPPQYVPAPPSQNPAGTPSVQGQPVPPACYPPQGQPVYPIYYPPQGQPVCYPPQGNAQEQPIYPPYPYMPYPYSMPVAPAPQPVQEEPKKEPPATRAEHRRRVRSKLDNR